MLAFEKCINKIKEFFNRKSSKLVKKQSNLNKTVVLGNLQIVPARHIEIGVKVLGKWGIAHIKEIKSYPWISVIYPFNPLKRTKEEHYDGRKSSHKVTNLKQYQVAINDKRNNIVRIFPLSYADYEYIDPDEEFDVWLEGHITKKGYFQLTDAEKKDRKVFTVFNADGYSQNVLRKLKSENLLTKIKK